MSTALNTIHAHRANVSARVGIVLGSGLSALADLVEDAARIPYDRLDGFPGHGYADIGVSGHGSDLVLGQLGGKDVAILTGREHYYEHGNAAAMRPALEALKGLGVETLLLTNSAGSLREDIAPGQLMLITDHINYAGMNPLIGEPTDKRFVNLVDAYDPRLRETARQVAAQAGIALNEGIYLWYSGPSFETVAEIRMAITLGADAVGMSTAPEVIVARMLGMRVLACSAITNMAAGLGTETISHEHTKSVAKKGAEQLQRLIPALLEAL